MERWGGVNCKMVINSYKKLKKMFGGLIWNNYFCAKIIGRFLTQDAPHFGL